MSEPARRNFTLEDLDQIIQNRRAATSEKSYTRSLLDKGPVHCGRKFGEEAIEFIIATTQGDQASMTGEAADVLYHFLVALQAADLSLEKVLKELESRTRMSGHEEKAARG